MWRLWEAYWFRKVPPHQYALIRIALGVIGLAIMAGLSDIDTFWRLDGLVNPTDSRVQQTATQLFGHDHAPVVAFGASVATYLLLSLGVGSHVTVPLAFVVAITQLSWNRLPLSGAYQVLLSLLFCLAFADCGGIWSVDSWWRRKRGRPNEAHVSIWPLRLLRFQVCLIYFITGWWKLQNVHWRDGSALQYVLSNTQFRRLPFDPPLWAAEFLTLGTYLTLFWELLFPVLVLHRTTRMVALAIGVMLHVGMLLTMELGTFPIVMMASYVAFLDPDTVPGIAARLRERFKGATATSAPL
jgi:hypothetical protein